MRTSVVPRVSFFLAVVAAGGCSVLLGLEDARDRPSDAAIFDAAVEATVAPPDAAGLTLSVGAPISVASGKDTTTEITLSGSTPLPLAIAVDGLPSGVTSDPLVIEVGRTRATLTIRATSAATTGVVPVTVKASHQATATMLTSQTVAVVRGAPGSVDTSLPTEALRGKLPGAPGLGVQAGGTILVVVGDLSATYDEDAGAIRPLPSEFRRTVEYLREGAVDNALATSVGLPAATRSSGIAVDDDANIFTSDLRGQGGPSFTNPPFDVVVTRYDGAGQYAATFTSARSSLGETFGALYGRGIVSKGRRTYVAVMGTSNYALHLGRLTSSGFDGDFGTVGFIKANTFLFQPDLAAVLPDGRFLVVGATAGGNDAARVVRISDTAARDPAFGNDDAGGFVAPSGDGGSSDRPSLAVLRDGRIAIAGTSGGLVVVTTAEGKLDTSFKLTPSSAIPVAVVEDEDRIVVLTETGIQRLLPDGAADPSFTVVTVPGGGFRLAVRDSFRRLVVLGNTVTRFWL